MLYLKSARKVKVEEVNEFSCWRLIILAAEELKKFLMFTHVAVCALHSIVWVKWLLQRKVICLVTSMELCWEALSGLLLLLRLLCERQAGSQLFACRSSAWLVLVASYSRAAASEPGRLLLASMAGNSADHMVWIRRGNGVYLEVR